MADIFPPVKQRPVWAVGALPEGVTVRRIDLRPDKRGFGGDAMLFNGKVIGKSEEPLYDAARWLLANNAASESDRIAVYRCETLSMHGIVGDIAKWTVVETKHGNPSLCLRPYVPFQASRVAHWLASGDDQVLVATPVAGTENSARPARVGHMEMERTEHESAAQNS